MRPSNEPAPFPCQTKGADPPPGIGAHLLKAPSTRTGTEDHGPEIGHRWARPICRPLRHPRGTVGCGVLLSDGGRRGKGGRRGVWEGEQEWSGRETQEVAVSSPAPPAPCHLGQASQSCAIRGAATSSPSDRTGRSESQSLNGVRSNAPQNLRPAARASGCRGEAPLGASRPRQREPEPNRPSSNPCPPRTAARRSP
jgi:hypothetical protein